MIGTKVHISFCLQLEKLLKNHWGSILLNLSLVVLFEGDGPPTTGPAKPSTANFVAIDGPAGLSMAAMDGMVGLSTVP